MNSQITPIAVHHLKTWPQFFKEIKERKKRYELRKDDRGALPGDFLVLHEWDPKTKSYTGKQQIVVISNTLKDVASFGLKPGFVIFDVRFHEEMTDEQKSQVQTILQEAL